MKLKTFMIINAIAAAIVGILLVVVPSLLIKALGLPLDTGMDLDGQLWGSELILMALICWFARNISDYRTQRGIVSAFTIANLISLVISVIGVVNHTFNAVGWVAVIAYAILFVVYGIYWLTQPGEMKETQPAQQQMHQPS
jgi:hypothetical protein